MKKDYEAEREKTLKSYSARQLKNLKILMHACCAPCATACVERLVFELTCACADYDLSNLTVYFYNPNMDGENEYERRLFELKRFLNEAYGAKIGLIAEKYDGKEFYDAVKGFEKCPEGGERCEKCFGLRLEKTAFAAAKNGFDYICTTLTVSPHKNAEILNETGVFAAEKFGVKWLYCDFKKKNGFLRSTELSQKYGLYRQNYCGCVCSKIEAADRCKGKTPDGCKEK